MKEGGDNHGGHQRRRSANLVNEREEIFSLRTQCDFSLRSWMEYARPTDVTPTLNGDHRQRAAEDARARGAGRTGRAGQYRARAPLRSARTGGRTRTIERHWKGGREGAGEQAGEDERRNRQGGRREAGREGGRQGGDQRWTKEGGLLKCAGRDTRRAQPNPSRRRRRPSSCPPRAEPGSSPSLSCRP